MTPADPRHQCTNARNAHVRGQSRESLTRRTMQGEKTLESLPKRRPIANAKGPRGPTAQRSRPASDLRVQGHSVPTLARSRFSKETCPILGLSANSWLNCRTGGSASLVRTVCSDMPELLAFIALDRASVAAQLPPPAAGLGFSKPGGTAPPFFEGCFHPPHRIFIFFFPRRDLRIWSSAAIGHHHLSNPVRNELAVL